MTTQPVGTRRPASLPGGVTGNAGQPVTWSSSRTPMTPFAIHAGLTIASCSAQVRTWPVSVMMLSRVPAFTSLPPGTAADSRWPGRPRHADQVSYEL
jgi:hypothetical protein